MLLIYFILGWDVQNTCRTNNTFQPILVKISSLNCQKKILCGQNLSQFQNHAHSQALTAIAFGLIVLLGYNFDRNICNIDILKFGLFSHVLPPFHKNSNA